MPTIMSHGAKDARGYVIVYLEVGEWVDAWCIGEPDDPHPWLVRLSKYTAVPNAGFTLVPLPPPEAKVFPSVAAAKKWRADRTRRYRERNEKWRPAPSIIPIRWWMAERIAAASKDAASATPSDAGSSPAT